MRLLFLELTAIATFMLAAACASAATTTCSTVAACVFGTNTATGYGVEGTSKANDGVVGITTKDATSAATGRAGVAGYDGNTNKNGFNSGVYGTSAYGSGVFGKASGGYGVVGSTSAEVTISTQSSARAGVYGQDLSTNRSPYNSGVAGTSNAGNGVSGSSATGSGLYGVSSENGFGVFGTSSNAGVFGDGSGRDSFGVSGVSPYGIGVGARTSTGVALSAVVISTGKIFTGESNDTEVISVDGRGNEILAGSLTTQGSPLVRTRNASGFDVASFGARTSAPSLEDVGKARLDNGASYVALDRTFASTIDPRVSYSVFITPEGDSNSLYTTELTPIGFAVRESKGGHSTLTFDYRIVAKPLDAAAMHLPTMNNFPQLSTHVKLRREEHRQGSMIKCERGA